jgi:putative transposase
MKRGTDRADRRRRRRARRPVQLGLRRCSGWGGRREGAGRKRGPQPRTPHRSLSRLASRHPVHVTLKVDDALPSLRGDALWPTVEGSLRRGRERDGFRLVHFSVQCHHLHLIVEAREAMALSHGVRGLSVRLARRINTALGRRGRVFVDRYFPRVLKTPRQARAALAYVLNNSRRHARQQGQRLAWGWIDECSSGRSFDGWRDRPRPPPRAARRGHACRGGDDEPLVVAPGTWLLSVGWRRHGLIAVNAVPGEP